MAQWGALEVKVQKIEDPPPAFENLMFKGWSDGVKDLCFEAEAQKKNEKGVEHRSLRGDMLDLHPTQDSMVTTSMT